MQYGYSTIARLEIIKGRSTEGFDSDTPIACAEFAMIWAGFERGLTWKAMIASPIFMDIEQRNSLNVLPRGAGSMAIRMARFAPMPQLHSDDQPCARPTAGKLNRIRSLT